MSKEACEKIIINGQMLEELARLRAAVRTFEALMAAGFVKAPLMGQAGQVDAAVIPALRRARQEYGALIERVGGSERSGPLGSDD